MQNKSTNKTNTGIIKLINLSKYYGSEIILDNISIEINSGRKYGLIGANGTGKTTILKLIMRTEEPSLGKIIHQKGIKIGYVPQNRKFDDDLTVWEYLLSNYFSIEIKLRKIEEELTSVLDSELEKKLSEYQDIRDTYDSLGGDEIKNRATRLLDSLGLCNMEMQKIHSLSGGEKNILSFAKALVSGPDLLILDEPDNHLDYKGLAWLEQFLINYNKTIIIVSHNRYLLDRVCTVIMEISNSKINEFSGNYSSWQMSKLRNLIAQQADYSANIKKLKRLENLVIKFREFASRTGDPKWGKRYKAMRSRFSREQNQAVEKPEIGESKIYVNFDTDKSKADIALQLIKYSRSFGEIDLFKDAELEVKCGERVALIGPNGSGKTTLVRDIVNKGSWNNSNIRIGPSQTVGYCSQSMEMFSGENTIEEEFSRLGSLTRNDVYKIISPFLFSWKDVEKRIKDLSGGEKNRLQLARLMYLNTNFLILDEPTNHLDILSREAVEEALINFNGTILVVSHDRYFLDKIIHRVVEIKDMSINSYDCNFSEYWINFNPVKPRSSGRIKTRNKERQKNNVSVNEKIANTEARITKLEQEKAGLENKIKDLITRGENKIGRNLSGKLEKMNQLLKELYTKWENLIH